MSRFEQAEGFGLALASRPDLPAGVRRSDCDGPPDPLADASSEQLWQACDERLQWAIAERFAAARADEVRDGLLETEHSPPVGRNDRIMLATLGEAIWRAWIAYRNSAVEDHYRRGRIQSR